MNKILIVGSGVIGSVMGVLFSASNQQIFMHARGRRLKELQDNGLLYRKKGEVKKANVHITDIIDRDIFYNYVFVTVRYEQIV